MSLRPILAIVGALLCMVSADGLNAQTYTMPDNDNYQSGSSRRAYGYYYYYAIGEVDFGGMTKNSNSEHPSYYSSNSEVQTSWDYTQQHAGFAGVGEEFELKVKSTNRGSSRSTSYSYFFSGVWVDWNKDGQFNNIPCVIDPADGWNGGEFHPNTYNNQWDAENFRFTNGCWYRSSPFTTYNRYVPTPLTHTFEIETPPGLNAGDYRLRVRGWNEYYYTFYQAIYSARNGTGPWIMQAPYMTATSLNRNGWSSSRSSSETEDYTLTLYDPVDLTNPGVSNIWAGSTLPTYTLNSSGGVGSHTYSMTDNSANNNGVWLLLDPLAGTLTGVSPSNFGGETINVTITATDEFGNTDSENIIFTVLEPLAHPHASDLDDPANRPYFPIQGSESSSSFAAGEGNDGSVGFSVVSTLNTGWQVVNSVADDPAQWLGATALPRMSGQEMYFDCAGETQAQFSFSYHIENTSNSQNAANVGVIISEDDGATWRAIGGPNADAAGPVYRGDTNGQFVTESIRFNMTGTQLTLGLRIMGLVRNDASLTKVVVDDFDFHVPLTLQPAVLPNGQQEVPYGPYELSTTGGLGESVQFIEDPANPLPEGLEIVEDNGSWFLQGVPGAPAAGFEEHFGIIANDDAGGSHTIQYTIALTAPPAALGISTESVLPTTALGVYSEWALEANGGLEPLAWSIVSGPEWLSIDNETGLLSGTPVGGEEAISVRVMVQDAAGRMQYRDADSRDFVISFTDKIQIDPSVFPNLPVIQLPNGEAAASYNQSIPLIGGTPPYAWSLAAGSGLPQGMELAEFEGFPFLTGTPFNEANGIYAFDLEVSDSASYLPTDPEYVEGENSVGTQTLTLSFRINIGLATSEVLNVTTEQGDFPVSLFEGESFEIFVAASGGRPPYSFAETGVGLPDFVTLTDTGRMVVAPQEGDGGNYLMSFEVTDVASGRDVATYNLEIGAPYNEPEIVNETMLPDAYVSDDYGMTFQVDGGQPPYIWTLVGGNDLDEDGLFEGGGLPAGLKFNPQAAHLSGIVLVSNGQGGETQIELQVEDAEGFVASKVFDLMIMAQEAPALTITTSNILDARLNERYGFSLESEGGFGGHVWSLKPGSSPLPRGLSLTEFGVITGTPKVIYENEPALFTLQVRDEAGALFEKQVSLSVLPQETQDTSGPAVPPVDGKGVVGAGGGCSISGNSSSWLMLIFAGLFGMVALRRRQSA